jgi:hypothetical protein
MDEPQIKRTPVVGRNPPLHATVMNFLPLDDMDTGHSLPLGTILVFAYS